MAPIAFTPIYKERVWGGRALQDVFGRPLPDGAIGEAWEIVDRPEAQSVVAAGPRAGQELHALWAGPDRERIFGARARSAGARFPVLVKLLDARDTLSVQVHPPAHLAQGLGGEPKDELWYVAAAQPGAFLLAGLRDGVRESEFAAELEAGGDVSGMLHRIPVEVGDVLRIPSGRVHALGAGCLVVEVQQNSDTTFRVFDFNRPGLDGELRELHIPESLLCIDFGDTEPPLHPRGTAVLADDEHFRVTRRELGEQAQAVAADGECAVVCVLEGEARCGGEAWAAGASFLVPADTAPPVAGPAAVLVIELP